MSSAREHTPGPWAVPTNGQDRRLIWNERGECVADLTRRYYALEGEGHAEADASRIVACVNALEGWSDPSAAGELLEAARIAVDLMEGFRCPKPETDRLRAAIARARGEQA